MKVNTSRFGEIEVDENSVFSFIEPILGYEHLSKYIIIDYDENSPFKWLQSVEDGNLAFPITFPAYFGIDYQFVIPEEEAKALGLVSAENLLTVNVVSIPQGDPKSSTVNLLGPLVFNTENRKAMQLILVNTNFPVKHRLFSQRIVPKKEQPEKVEK